MRKFDKRKRPRSAVKSEDEATFDAAALALAVWLGLLVLVKFVELMPSLPAVPAGQVWAMAALGA